MNEESFASHLKRFCGEIKKKLIIKQREQKIERKRKKGKKEKLIKKLRIYLFFSSNFAVFLRLVGEIK